MHILVTRPEPDDATFKSRLEAAGHRVSLSPLIRIAATGETLPLEGVGAVAVTSRNSLRALASRPEFIAVLKLPIFAVGPGTAQTARDLGFKTCFQGPGTGDQLAQMIANHREAFHGKILHLAGDRRAGDLAGSLEAAGIASQTVVLYRSIAANTFSPGIAEAIRSGAIDAVILMSPRTARVFSELVTKEGLVEAAAQLQVLCISKAAANCLANLEMRNVSICCQPNAEEMLALVARVAAKSA